LSRVDTSTGVDIAARPVGVFDSGVGGLSVLREIVRELPHEHVLYVADSRHAPYGDRGEDFIVRRSRAIVEFLVREQAKAVVVACNTATGVAIASLRAAFAIPIVGIEPAVKPAAASTRSGVVGVLATSRTLASAKFKRLLEQHGSGVRVLAQACPGLVEQVEAGDLSGPGTRSLVARYVAPLVAQGADTIVLGCTHYVALIPMMREAAGPAVDVIDPAGPVARELGRRLREVGMLARSGRAGRQRFWTSGDPDRVGPVIGRLWTADIDIERLPPQYCEVEEKEE
jgi:glutamate racemase